MVDTTSLAVAVLGALTVALVTGWVYRDAARLGFGRPWLWAGIVFTTTGLALVLHLGVGTIPVPGLLVIAVGGIALYLFERDDAVHGDEPADPHALPGERGASNSDGRPSRRADATSSEDGDVSPDDGE